MVLPPPPACHRLRRSLAAAALALAAGFALSAVPVLALEVVGSHPVIVGGSAAVSAEHAALLVATPTPTPTHSPTPTPTPKPSSSPSPTPTPTPTPKPSSSPSPTPAPSPTSSTTPHPSTPAPTPAPTALPAATAAPVIDTSPTPAPSPPPTPAPSPTATLTWPSSPPSGDPPSLADVVAFWTVTPALGGALTGWPIASAILGSGATGAFEWAACVVLLAAALGVVFRRPLARLPLGRLPLGRRRWPWQRTSA